MKSIVIYNSKTGFTEKYAGWISEKIGCKAISYKNMTPNEWRDNEVIIYGGGIMAGKIAGWDKIKSNPMAAGKKLLLFGVGATPMEAADVIETIKNANLSGEEQQKIPFFYFEGGINYEKMGFFPRMILGVLYKSLKKKQNKTPEDIGMMKVFEKSSDSAKEEYVEELVECVAGQYSV